jgi:hypothetical protein
MSAMVGCGKISENLMRGAEAAAAMRATTQVASPRASSAMRPW